MKYLLKSIPPVYLLMLISAAGYSQKTGKSIYANVPSLDEVSGIWMNADTLAMTPSVRNFRGNALLNKDMTSLSWFVSAPFSGGYHTGVIRVNGDAPHAQLYRWQPWQALRKTTEKNYRMSSSVRMLPDHNVIMWEVTISNPTQKTQIYNVQQDLIGFISNYEHEEWPWPYPYPTTKGKTNERNDEIVNVIKNIGLKPKDFKQYHADESAPGQVNSANAGWPLDTAILNCSKYKMVSHSNTDLLISDNETSCFSAYRILDAPDRLDAKNSGGTAYWKIELKPGQSKTIRFMLVYGKTQADVMAGLNLYCNSFKATFAGVETTWKTRWAAMFRPGNNLFSGSFPVLATNDKAAKKVYYTGPLTALYLLNTNLPAHKRVFLTGGPRWGATVMFFWDTSLWSEMFAELDPAMMKEIITGFMKVDPSKHFGVDNFTGKGVGNGYVANYWALFQLLRSYITVTNDYGFLNEELNGKKIIDYMTDYAYHWKAISIYGQPDATSDIYKLADFGDNPWNLLECVPTYIHIVPSFNIGYVWMMRETAKFDQYLGKDQEAAQLNKDANDMAQRVLKLYAGNGVWYSLYPNNKKVEVRHVMDFMYIGNYMSQDISQKTKEEMRDFAENELFTNTWMRAQSLKDIAAKYSDRPDHGPLGAYDGWPAGSIDALSQMGFTARALKFYRAVEPVTYEGCWAQAHELWGENKYNKNARVRIPERGWTAREAIEGVEFSQDMLKNFFGFYPQVNGKLISNTLQPIKFKGKLYNVRYGGKLYNLSCDNGKNSMIPASN
jgi:hypothetical protein